MSTEPGHVDQRLAIARSMLYPKSDRRGWNAMSREELVKRLGSAEAEVARLQSERDADPSDCQLVRGCIGAKGHGGPCVTKVERLTDELADARYEIEQVRAEVTAAKADAITWYIQQGAPMPDDYATNHPGDGWRCNFCKSYCGDMLSDCCWCCREPVLAADTRAELGYS